MSGSEEEDRAGLFVLGALNGEEMREVRREAARDPTMARAIEAWERRLAPLAALAPEVSPPEALWAQLDARVARLSGQEPTVEKVYSPPQHRARSRRRTGATVSRGALTLWRATAVASMAVAAGLAGVLILRAPDHPRVSMILPSAPGVGGWMIQLHSNGQIEANAQGALSHTLDQDFELWALPEGSKRPLPLGLLQQNNRTVLNAGNVPRGKFQLLVSLEPKGGSPSGLPTGPVMFAGNVGEN